MTLLKLARYHEDNCNHHVNGKCTTAGCLRRGGYKSGGFDWDNPPATCEERETAKALRDYAASLTSDNRENETK
jgi:hypothetical protein